MAATTSSPQVIRSSTSGYSASCQATAAPIARHSMPHGPPQPWWVRCPGKLPSTSSAASTTMQCCNEKMRDQQWSLLLAGPGCNQAYLSTHNRPSAHAIQSGLRPEGDLVGCTTNNKLKAIKCVRENVGTPERHRDDTVQHRVGGVSFDMPSAARQAWRMHKSARATRTHAQIIPCVRGLWLVTPVVHAALRRAKNGEQASRVTPSRVRKPPHAALGA